MDTPRVHGELIDLEHFVDFARRVAKSQSFTKDIRTNLDAGHSAGPEAVARIPRRFTQGRNTRRPRRNRPSCPAAGVAQIRQAAMGV
jgi:hypothetical protein